MLYALLENGESACGFPNSYISNDSDTSITQTQFLKQNQLVNQRIL